MISVYYTRRILKYYSPMYGTIGGVVCDQRKKYSFGHALEFTDIIYIHFLNVSYCPNLNRGNLNREVTKIKSWTI